MKREAGERDRGRSPGRSLKSETAVLLRKHGITVRKRFGQNFLIDGEVLKSIIEAAEIDKEDFVLEIGPGLGLMTKLLSERAGHVTAVEIDRDLIPVLNETLLGLDNVEIINEDILKVDLFELAGNRCPGKKMKIVANLPYYITTPIIMEILESSVPVDTMTFMVQKEVADRMAASPGSKAYGSLSLSVQYRARAETVAVVPPSAFMPEPGVTSEVVHLSCYDEPPVKVSDEGLLFRVIRVAFGERRKTLVNALSSGGRLGVSKERIASLIDQMGKSPTVRGEELTLSEFARLAELVMEK